MENKFNEYYSIECDILTEDDQVICSQFLISNGVNNVFIKKDQIHLMNSLFKGWEEVKFDSLDKAIGHMDEMQKELSCTIDANLLFSEKVKKVNILCIRFYLCPVNHIGIVREILLERLFYNKLPDINKMVERRARLRRYYSIFYWIDRLKYKIFGDPFAARRK